MEDIRPLSTPREGAPYQSLSDSHSRCFACGSENHRGLGLQFAINPAGVAVAVWEPAAVFRSYPDRIHGGILATLMDSAVVHALFARGITGVTAELTVRYLHGVNVSDSVTVRGWIENSRHRLYRCRAEIHQVGTVAAYASAKLMEMSDKVR